MAAMHFSVVLLTFLHVACSKMVEDRFTTARQVFNFRLSSLSFNMSSWQGRSDQIDDQLTYHGSLPGHPDLPNWCQLSTSQNGKYAFLYGIPPEPVSELEVVAINQRTYEASTLIVRIHLLPKPDPARYEVRMKINNFDIGDFLDRDGISRLSSVFRIELWPEAAKDLHVTFLSSALHHGARKPLKATDGEGLYLTLGSKTPFSHVLLELQREVGPLWNSRPCPREFKKTSLEKNFRSRGFIVDWCSFRLISLEAETSFDESPDSFEGMENVGAGNDQALPGLPGKARVWTAPAKHEIPKRSYAVDGMFTIFVPIVVGIIGICIISFVLGVYPIGQDIKEGELYESFFDEFTYESDQSVVQQKDNLSDSESDDDEYFHRQDSESGFLPPSQHLSPPSAAENSSFSRDSTPYRTSMAGMSLEGKHDLSPYSTMSRSGVPTASATPYGSLSRSLARQVEARASTLNRPKPPPYAASRKSTIGS